MAAYKKLAELAYKLHQMTIKGKVAWQETVAAGVYQASFSNYSLQISLESSESLQGAKDIRISVFGDDGNEIESFIDEDINQWISDFGDFRSGYHMMHETYEIARRSALGTEQAIDQILLDLEDDEIPF